MKVLIASPFLLPEEGVLGGYAQEIQEALIRAGHECQVVAYSALERALPIGLRHAVYVIRCLVSARSPHVILALDTWSVGLPAFFVARVCGARFCMRLGGDFLWESYEERTKKLIRLTEFYTPLPTLTLKEKIIFHCTQFVLQHADVLFFTTRFQADLWKRAYTLSDTRIRYLENHYPSTRTALPAKLKTFVSAGRPIALKNYDLLARVFERLQKKYPDITLDTRRLSPATHRARIAESYAVIIPSVSEVSSNTAIDAVCAGKPFIMSSDTGTSERLGECGVFIDTRKEEELLHAIESLLDQGTYERYMRAVQTFAFTHSWDDIAREIISAIEQA